jgi:phosphatidylglycerol:prolipoprotein diacylglycerol transferase
VWPNLAQFGSFNFPTYLVINSLAFCLAIVWIFKRSLKAGLNQNAALDLSLTIMVAGFIGARAAHVLLEEPKFYAMNLSMIFEFWHGGFVYYGGFFAAVLASSIFCKMRKCDFRAYADVFAPVVAGAYAIGRMGCLAAGCCFGRPTTLPWGITFPLGAEAPSGIKLHPTQIYFSLWEAALCITILYLQKRKVFAAQQGQYFGLWLLLHAIGRAVIEQFRGDFRGQKIFNLSLSTWLSGLAVGLAIYMLVPIRFLTKEA